MKVILRFSEAFQFLAQPGHLHRRRRIAFDRPGRLLGLIADPLVRMVQGNGVQSRQRRGRGLAEAAQAADRAKNDKLAFTLQIPGDDLDDLFPLVVVGIRRPHQPG